MLFGLFVFAAIVLGVIWFASAYNNLVSAAHRAAQAWGNVDALLRQRHEELPRFLGACEQLVHEPAALERARQARSALYDARQTEDVASLSSAEAALRAAIGELRELAKSRESASADSVFAALDQRLGVLERGIDERRVPFNEAVAQNNASVSTFPGQIVALLGGFKRRAPFQF